VAGTDVPWVLVASAAIVILYFACRWFADLKARRKALWLSYV
jgi:hypothetical protein